MRKSKTVSNEKVINLIYHIRGKKVMFDRDLADMYGVKTSALNQAVKRNKKRFPKDFMFQLTNKELKNWMSQTVTSNFLKMGLRKLPYVFTEQGVAMLSSVLKSDTAINVNIKIIRIFSRMREMLLTHKDILTKLELLEKKMFKQESRQKKNEDEILIIFNALKQLLNPPQKQMEPIGFKISTNKTIENKKSDLRKIHINKTKQRRVVVKSKKLQSRN